MNPNQPTYSAQELNQNYYSMLARSALHYRDLVNRDNPTPDENLDNIDEIIAEELKNLGLERNYHRTAGASTSSAGPSQDQNDCLEGTSSSTSGPPSQPHPYENQDPDSTVTFDLDETKLRRESIINVINTKYHISHHENTAVMAERMREVDSRDIMEVRRIIDDCAYGEEVTEENKMDEIEGILNEPPEAIRLIFEQAEEHKIGYEAKLDEIKKKLKKNEEDSK